MYFKFETMYQSHILNYDVGDENRGSKYTRGRFLEFAL